MTNNEPSLPHLSEELYLTDGGLETTLVFHDSLDLPYFAAFDLLKDIAGTQRLQNYFQQYIDLAIEHGLGFILGSPTWRASADWGEKLGYSKEALALANRRSIEMLHALRERNNSRQERIVISGDIGPRGDGYNPETVISPNEAAEYHVTQIRTLTDAGADFITALTLPAATEAVGIVQAGQHVNIPVVVSFTVETDGRLPDGQSLASAIEEVDSATDNGPAYYMINCAHPTHFKHILNSDDPCLNRIAGIRSNASSKSHAELDESETLDEGNPEELGRQTRALRDLLPSIKVVGGCCGTDHRHLGAIARACSDQV